MEIKKLELNRRLFHMGFGLLIVLLFYFDILTSLILLTVITTSLILSVLSRKYKIPIIYWGLKTFERKENLKKFPGRGVIYYLAGTLFVIVFFQKDIALASIMILALGDSFSHLVGRYYGTIRHPFSNKKFLEGAIAGIIFGFGGAVIFVKPLEAFLASLIAMVVEGFELKLGMERVDDNIVIPVVAAIVIWLLRLI